MDADTGETISDDNSPARRSAPSRMDADTGETISDDNSPARRSVPSRHDTTGDDVGQSRLRQNSANRTSPRAQNAKLDTTNPNDSNDNGNNAKNPFGNKLGNRGPVKNASQNLLKNKANRFRNLPFFNKKNNGQKASDNPDASNNNQNDSLEEEGKKDLIKKAKTIKLVISILAAILPFLLIMIVVIFISSSIAPILNFFGIVATGGGGEFPTSMTDNPNEKKYYEKLDSVVASYQRKCGISLNKNYIHSILFYPIQNYDEFFDQEFSIEDNGSSGEIDYSSLAGKVDSVANLMVNNCSVDYEIEGEAYEKIKNSSFFKNYYKDLLKDSSADDILSSVFELAETGTEMFSSSWYISDNLKVVQKTCNSNEYLNGSKVNSTIDFSEYIMGVIYGELDANTEITQDNKEFLKAQVIAATSYVLSRANYQSGDTEIVVQNGECWQQTSCNVNKGCTFAYDLGQYGTCYMGIQDKNKTSWQKNPISSSKLSLLKEVMDDVFGTVMLDPSGDMKRSEYHDGSCGSNCMDQKSGIIDAKNGMNYEEILNKYYSNFTLNNVSEDLYADVTYEAGGYNENVVFYDQNDYGNVVFCGRTPNSKNPGTIKSSGCGTTAMAIVLSTLVDKSYDPVAVMEEAYSLKSCGRYIEGTLTSFFKKSAKLHNLSYKSVGKNGDLQTVLNALKSGNSLVIAHMGQGTFTSGGHYIVLSRVNDKGQVYVYDPYHAVNVKKRKSGNGWYDFNTVIAKQIHRYGRYHIITKG